MYVYGVCLFLCLFVVTDCGFVGMFVVCWLLLR